MTDAVFTLTKGSGRQTVRLSSFLAPDAQERSTDAALNWIKQLRHARVDGEPFRHRFTYRDDSLWWFSEIYLHKQRVVETIFRTSAALDALISSERPSQLRLEEGSLATRLIAQQTAAAHGVGYIGAPITPGQTRRRLLALDARATWLHTAALASRLRGRTSASLRRNSIAAFVHRAFVRGTGDEGTDEAYVGPVLAELEKMAGKEAITYITLGPAENFSARRWWRSVRGGAPTPGLTIESLAPLETLKPSRNVWRQRYRNRTALWNSADMRELSMIEGHDCWPLLREELAGIALLQWPWSARAMDEAGAALDALTPSAALTYAEAGGWGRALMLESRRRKIPGIGLQHGFIYRHWLNYLHEPDEMEPGPHGFTRPALTLLFDGYAERHLQERGNFPHDSLLVTGSPRLDAIIASAGALNAEEIARTRTGIGANSKTLVLVVTKYREAQHVLPALVDAAARIAGVRLAIKTHPAETPDVYASLTAKHPHVSVLPAATPLAPLILASRALVTVNSTVALDAAVLGVPSLVIGLPNNLTPFVEAGVMAGADRDGIGPALQQILYDEEFRERMDDRRSVFLSRYRIGSDGTAAARSARAILRAARSGGVTAPPETD
jgi:hypothetical protein